MATEIERKFLVTGDAWRSKGTRVLLRQGYLCNEVDRVVRVRVNGNDAYLTIKGRTEGIGRSEYEYGIPTADAEEMLRTIAQRPIIEKYRTTFRHAGHTWEIDEFLGANAGLVVAEVELRDADDELEVPPWVGREVSHDARYYNANLISHPYSAWTTR